MHSTTDQLRALDKAHLWHPFTPMSLWLDSEPVVITRAEGMYLFDSDGNKYLDGVSSLWCNVHGHRVPQIDQAIRDQLDKVAHTTMLGLASEPAILLADRLTKIVPSNLKKVFYSDAGATATEIAFKLAAQYWYNLGHPEKHEFIGFTEAYHGDTTGAMSIGRTTTFHKPYFPLLFKVHYAPSPHSYRPPPQFSAHSPSPGTPGEGWGEGLPGGGRGGAALLTSAAFPNPKEVADFCLAKLRELLDAHHQGLAAIAIEPIVQGAAGIIIHPPGFLTEVRRLATQYNTLLICDEVATGFGRTGKMFAVEHENVEPDLMCLAKGISGGYLPLAATFATQQIFDAFLGPPSENRTFFHGHTYTGNPLACAAALASLDLFKKNHLIESVQQKSQQLSQLLEPLKTLPHVGDIRQKGLMVGIELVENKSTRQSFDPSRRIGHLICNRLRAHGVILRPLGDVIVLMPPLAMPIENIATILDAVRVELARL